MVDLESAKFVSLQRSFHSTDWNESTVELYKGQSLVVRFSVGINLICQCFNIAFPYDFVDFPFRKMALEHFVASLN